MSDDLRTALTNEARLRQTLEATTTKLAEASAKCGLPLQGPETWPMDAANEILRLRAGGGLAALEAATVGADLVEVVYSATELLRPWTARVIKTRGEIQTLRTVRALTLAELLTALAR